MVNLSRALQEINAFCWSSYRIIALKNINLGSDSLFQVRRMKAAILFFDVDTLPLLRGFAEIFDCL